MPQNKLYHECRKAGESPGFLENNHSIQIASFSFSTIANSLPATVGNIADCFSHYPKFLHKPIDFNS